MADQPGGNTSRTLLLIAALVVVVALAWWLMSNGSEEEPTYEAGVTDESGGELIVTDPEETGVPIDLPETPMTNVPADEGSAAEPPAE